MVVVMLRAESNTLQDMTLAEQTSSTIIVSPIARPKPSTTAASSPHTLKRHQKNRNHDSGSRKITIAELMNRNQLTMLSTNRTVTIAAKIKSASVVSRLTQTLPSSLAKRDGNRSFTTKLPPQLMSELNEPMNAATSAATSNPMKPCGKLDALMSSPHA